MSEVATKEISTRQILDEIINSKKELKNSISASETRLILEIQELKGRLNCLERENLELKEQLELSKRQQNKNNLIIFGLKKRSEKVTTALVCEELTRLLEVGLVESDIGDLYPLGKTKNCPIKIELISHLKKKLIFKNTKKLKNTGVSIANDLTLQQREEIKTLNKFLKNARQEGQEAYIRGNKLVIGKNIYTLEDLENTGEEVKSSSAPHTPLRDRKQSSCERVISDYTEGEANGPSCKIPSIHERAIKKTTPQLTTHKKIYTSKEKSAKEGATEAMKLRSRPMPEN